MATSGRSRTHPSHSAKARRARAAARQQRRRRQQIAAVVAAALAVFGAVAVIAFTGGQSAGVGSAAGYSATKTAFDLPALTGTGHVRLAGYAGRPVVVNFFASWCVYCNEELPGFVQVAKATRGKVAFIGVDTDDTGDGAAMARRFDLAGAGFALARDIGPAPASELWTQYGSQGLPVTAFYNASGRLVDFSGGMLTQAQLQQRIRTDFGIDVRAPNAANLAAPVIPVIPRGAFELLRTHVGDPSFVTLDIRTPAQFGTGHVPGARNIDASAPGFRTRLAGLSRDATYFVVSQTGTRGATVAALLHQIGFKHVYDVQGGLVGWQQAGLPIT